MIESPSEKQMSCIVYSIRSHVAASSGSKWKEGQVDFTGEILWWHFVFSMPSTPCVADDGISGVISESLN